MPFITQGKTNLKYILIVVVLAAIVGGGIFNYYYYWMKELEDRLATLELKLPTIKSLEDETADWKIYKDEEYGFEIKYPVSWFAYNNTKLGFAAISTFPQEKYDKYFRTADEEKLGENYGLIHIDYIEDRPLEEIFESVKGVIEKTIDNPDPSFKIEEYSGQELNIDGSRGHGIYYRASFLGQTYYEEGIYGIYLIADKNGQGVIGFEGKFIGKIKDKEVYKEYAKKFPQMIFTFRFLE